MLLTVLLLAGCAPEAPPLAPSTDGLPDISAVSSPANVVIVSVDTLRADRLGCYGNPVPTSPEIDRFAGDAVIFENTIAQAPSTLPSHASLLTSLLPSHHGASYGLSTPLPEEIITTAEVLRDAGWATAAFTGGGQLAPAYGIAQGFDRYEEPRQADTLNNTVEAAVEWLESEQPERFLLFLHTYEVHSPYTPEPEILAQLESGYEGDLPPTISNELIDRINSGEVELGQGDLEHILACYDAEIRSTDAGFGRFVAYLREAGLYDNTLIVFTSDHGEEFGEHGVVGWHSHTLYDELLRVPLLVKFPQKWAAGQSINSQVRLIDVAPTITGTLGLDPVEQFTGTDLRRVVEACTPADLAAVSQQDSDTGFRYSSLRTGEWKIYPSKLFNRDTMRGESLARRAAVKIGALWRPFRLLNLREDPGEHHDVGSANRGVRKRLRTALEERLAARPEPETLSVEIDDETEEKLKALGYIE